MNESDRYKKKFRMHTIDIPDCCYSCQHIMHLYEGEIDCRIIDEINKRRKYREEDGGKHYGLIELDRMTVFSICKHFKRKKS